MPNLLLEASPENFQPPLIVQYYVNSKQTYFNRNVFSDGVGCEHGTCNSHSGGNYCICETGWSGAGCDQCVPYWDCPEKGALSCTHPNECICTTPGISDPKGLCGMEALKRVTEAP